MIRGIVAIGLLCCLVGCASTAGKEETPDPMALELPYEVVWRAAVDIVEKDFQIERRDGEKGEILSRYKEGRTVLEPWGIDAQTRYQCIEETLHRVRRRVLVRVVRTELGVTVQLTVPRERLNYEPPPTEFEPGPPTTPEERKRAHIQAVRTPQEQWTFMGNDELLAQRILRDIAGRARELSVGGASAIKSLG